MVIITDGIDEVVMRYARDLNGFLVDAENNSRHGYFICLSCHCLAHWRKESVDQRRPHFYHAEANEDCPLSIIGGSWNLLDDENVGFLSEANSDQLIFKRKASPNLSRIPLDIIENEKLEYQIPLSDMRIRLKSTDVAQLDYTVSLFCNFIKNQNINSFGCGSFVTT